MATRSVNIPSYNKLTSNIVAGNKIEPSDQINNYTAIENSIDPMEAAVEAHEKSLASIERQNHIQTFDDAKVSTGANTIAIDAGATTYIEVDSNGTVTTRTGWAASGSIDVSGISGSGVMWAVYPALTYQATSGTRPAGGLRVFTFTNNAGTVINNPKTWENSLETNNFIFERSVRFNGGASNMLPANYHDAKIIYTTANQITIKAGSRFRSADNTRDIIFNADYIVDMSNATPTFSQGGRTVAEAANTLYYLYTSLDSNNRPIAWFDTANLAGGGSVTNPAALSTGRTQIKMAIVNNATSDIEEFVYSDNCKLRYINPIVLQSAAGFGVGWLTQSCTGFVPPFSRLAYVSVRLLLASGTTALSMQHRVDSTKTAWNIGALATTSTQLSTSIDQALTTSQSYQYNYHSTGVAQAGGNVYLHGYEVTEI